jgi:hypothetical protein
VLLFQKMCRFNFNVYLDRPSREWLSLPMVGFPAPKIPRAERVAGGGEEGIEAQGGSRSRRRRREVEDEGSGGREGEENT